MRLKNISILFLLIASSLFIKSLISLTFISLVDFWIYVASGGESDIAARGPILMGTLLGPILVFVFFLCIGIEYFLLKKRQANYLYSFLIPPVAVVVIIILTFSRIFDYPVGLIEKVVGNNISAYVYNFILLFLSIWIFIEKRFICIANNSAIDKNEIMSNT